MEIGETTLDKPLVFLLEPNTAAEEQQLAKDFNMVTVTITSGNDKVTCSILNFYGLCTLPAVTH